jgi:hypothetical protein
MNIKQPPTQGVYLCGTIALPCMRRANYIILFQPSLLTQPHGNFDRDSHERRELYRVRTLPFFSLTYCYVYTRITKQIIKKTGGSSATSEVDKQPRRPSKHINNNG